MSKVTKKELQRAIQRQESRIDRLVGLLAKKGYYDKGPEPQLKQLDQSDDIVKEPAEVDLSIELTGSDLCRKMLERGDKYIMCVVGALRALVIIDTLEDGKFYSFGAIYENPKPINNQGEPLTASEVGL